MLWPTRSIETCAARNVRSPIEKPSISRLRGERARRRPVEAAAARVGARARLVARGARHERDEVVDEVDRVAQQELHAAVALADPLELRLQLAAARRERGRACAGELLDLRERELARRDAELRGDPLQQERPFRLEPLALG